MYLAESALWLGWALLYGSAAVFLGLLLLCAAVGIIAPREERALDLKFGEAYRQYAARVPRWAVFSAAPSNQHDLMPRSRRSRVLLAGSALLAAVPVIFGVIRAVSTGDDFRYLWLAAAALFGTAAVMALGRGASGPVRVSLVRALGAVAAGVACAAATALLLGATAGPGVAIVSLGFGLCSGASGTLATLARQPRSL